MVLRILRHISPFRLQDSHLLRSAFPHCSTTALHELRGPNPNGITTIGLASSDFARHYFRNLGWFLFLRLLRCFSSAGSLRIPMYSVYGYCSWQQQGFPIRISTTITLICSSSWLFAAYHVLLRLPVPRHSPCALFSLNFVLNRKSVIFCYFVVIFLHPKLLRKTFYLKNHFSYRLLSCARFAFSPILFSMSFSIMLFALCPFLHLTSAKLLQGFHFSVRLAS